jgi:uncharacterized damage-inducible protein DinB
MNEIISELQSIAQNAQNTFGNLSPEQINWKPTAKSWSIGQCFEHLIKSNELYYRDFGEIADGTRRNSFYENYSPLSGFFGKFIANALKKDNQRAKTIPQAAPLSETDSHIIEKFAAHQADLIKRISAMKNADWRKTKLTSPFLKIATYNLMDTFRIIIEHEKHHFRQAEKILQTADFL